MKKHSPQKRASAKQRPVKEALVRSRVQIPIFEGGVMAEFVTFKHLADSKEHIAIALGPWQSASSPLVRVHSECLTGDVFGSAKCDCGLQLDDAVVRLNAEGGILLYLRQEGRGIGLYNKLDAYALQARGHDTFEANRMLNFPDDLRDYKVAAQMLSALGVSQVKLLSNNPDKASQLEKYGIKVADIYPTLTFASAHNASYLMSKAVKAKHKLVLEDILKVSKVDLNSHL